MPRPPQVFGLRRPAAGLIEGPQRVEGGHAPAAQQHRRDTKEKGPGVSTGASILFSAPALSGLVL
eukprot:gene30949-41199_t